VRHDCLRRSRSWLASSRRRRVGLRSPTTCTHRLTSLRRCNQGAYGPAGEEPPWRTVPLVSTKCTCGEVRGDTGIAGRGCQGTVPWVSWHRALSVIGYPQGKVIGHPQSSPPSARPACPIAAAASTTRDRSSRSRPSSRRSRRPATSADAQRDAPVSARAGWLWSSCAAGGWRLTHASHRRTAGRSSRSASPHTVPTATAAPATVSVK
jgi:hypothetical protein